MNSINFSSFSPNEKYIHFGTRWPPVGIDKFLSFNRTLVFSTYFPRFSPLTRTGDFIRQVEFVIRLYAPTRCSAWLVSFYKLFPECCLHRLIALTGVIWIMRTTVTGLSVELHGIHRIGYSKWILRWLTSRFNYMYISVVIENNWLLYVLHD